MEKIIIPALDEERMQEVRAGYAKIDKPAANLGKLEDMVVGLAGMIGKDLPDKLKTAMVLMCGDHGIAKYGVSAYPQEVTRQMINGYMRGIDPLLTVGRGSGINDERMKIKRQVVIDGLAKNMPKQGDAMDILCKVGGYDHAGLAGVIIGAARRRVPTMVDGVNATAAALLAYGLYQQCRDYMLCSHLSSDISHKKMLELLQLSPIVDAGMRLGEGTGASLAIVVLQAAMDVYNHLSR